LPNAKDNDSTTENRDRIHEYIKRNPGVHLRMIGKELDIAMGNVQYHLSILEKSGKIKSMRINLHRYYYTAEILDDKHKAILAFLRHETARDILVYLLEHPGSTQKDIIDFKHFAPPTISWHMSRLVESGIVRSNKEERKLTRYSLSDLQATADFLRAYHPNSWDKLLNRFAELFLQLSTRTEEKDER